MKSKNTIYFITLLILSTSLAGCGFNATPVPNGGDCVIPNDCTSNNCVQVTPSRRICVARP